MGQLSSGRWRVGLRWRWRPRRQERVERGRRLESLVLNVLVAVGSVTRASGEATRLRRLVNADQPSGAERVSGDAAGDEQSG
jgi:hypothetical protein